MGSGVSVPPELPYHSSTFYNGKILEPLSAVNEGELRKIDCGAWSDTVPEQLRTIIQQPDKYREAIAIINTVSQTKVRFKSYWPLLVMAIVITCVTLLIFVGIPLLLHELTWDDFHKTLIIVLPFAFALDILLNFIGRVLAENRRIVRELQKAIGQANSLLLEEKILMGAQTNSKLLLVYVCVDGCRQELSAQSPDHELFDKGILDYSSAYTCCLANRRFPFKPISSACHLQGALCFCQFVFCRQFMNKCCFCCRKPDSNPALTSGGVSNPSYVGIGN